MSVGLVGVGGARVLRGWARGKGKLGPWSGRPWFCFRKEGFGKGSYPSCGVHRQTAPERLQMASSPDR